MWHIGRVFKGPAGSTNPVSEQVFGHACFANQLCESDLATSISEKPVRYSIIGLLLLSCPTAVAGLVIAHFVRVTVNRMVEAGTHAHVSQKVFEALPFVANGDVVGSVIRKCWF